MAIKRLKTGIKGFDKLVEGGFTENSTVLVCGTPGTGKTIFGLEYLYNGATKFNEYGLYITFEQPEQALINQASQFGWDLKKLIDKKLIKVIYIPVYELDENIIKIVEQEIKKNKIKRLVIDSISTLAVNAPIYNQIEDISLVDIIKKKSFFSPPIIGDLIIKRFIYLFIDKLLDLDCTSILISEASEKGDYLSRDTISEFACDGVILINFESMGGEFSRSLMVRKMRNTKNNEDIHPLEIGKAGLVVHDLK